MCAKPGWRRRSVVWQDGSVMSLGRLRNADEQTWPTAIDEQGHIAGVSGDWFAGERNHAVLWTLRSG